MFLPELASARSGHGSPSTNTRSARLRATVELRAPHNLLCSPFPLLSFGTQMPAFVHECRSLLNASSATAMPTGGKREVNAKIR